MCRGWDSRGVVGRAPRLRLHLRAFGLYACFACWSTLTFQGAALPEGPGGAGLAQVARASYMVTLALAALLVGIGRGASGKRARSARQFVLAAAGMSGGCAVCLVPGLSEQAIFPSVTLGMGLAALGTAAIVPYYGMGFRFVGPKATAVYVLAGYIVSGTFLELLSPAMRLAAVLILPVAMAWLAWLCLPPMADAAPPRAAASRSVIPPLPPRVLAVSAVSGFLGMLVQSAMLFADVEVVDDSLAPYIVRVSGLALFIVAIAVFGRSYDATSVFWPFAVLPAIAASLVLPFIGGAFPAIAMALFTMARHYLSSFTLSLYADLSGRLGRDAGAVFCFGRSADSIGCLVGLATGYLLVVVAAPTVHFWYVISGICLCMATAAFSLALFNRRFTDPDEVGTTASADLASGAGQTGGNADAVAQNTPARAAARAFGLSPREAEILGYLTVGRSIPFIAEEMGVSMSTVKTHTRGIYRKAGVHTRQELLDAVYSVHEN